MKKLGIITVVSAAIILAVFLGTSLYFTNLEKKTDERIQKVMEFQGISPNSISYEKVNYHKLTSFWGKEIFFKDDPGIAYEYGARVGQDRVIVFATKGGVPLENSKKKAKYILPEVLFNKNNEIIKVTDMRTNKVLFEK